MGVDGCTVGLLVGFAVETDARPGVLGVLCLLLDTVAGTGAVHSPYVSLLPLGPEHPTLWMMLFKLSVKYNLSPRAPTAI